MRISKEEIKHIAGNIKLDLTDKEIEEIGDSIEEITKSLDEMLAIDTDCDRKIMGNEKLSNIYNQFEDDGVCSSEVTGVLNDFDGEYVVVKKVEGNDEA